MRPAWLRAAILPGICGLIWATLTGLGQLDVAERLSYDFRLRTQAAVGADPRLVVVALDDESLGFIGTWPWPRDLQAKLVDQLSEARVVLWDAILADPGQPKKDKALADALRRNGHVLLAAGSNNTYNHGNAFTLPDIQFQSAAAGTGFVQFHPDSDGVLRCSLAIEHASDSGSLPMLHRAVAALVDPHLPLPVGPVYFNFQGGETLYPHVPAAHLLLGTVPKSRFKDKIVVVGATADGLNDRVITPFEVMSGVIYNGQATISWLRGDWRQPLPRWVAMLCAGVVAMLTVMALESLTTAVALTILMSGLLALLISDTLVFRFAHTWLPTTTMTISSLGSMLVFGVTYQMTMTMRLRRAIERLLGAFRQRQVRMTSSHAFQGERKRLPAREQVSALLQLTDTIYEEWHFFQALIATNQNPVVVCDEVQAVMLGNPAALSLFGEELATGNLRTTMAALLDEPSLTACDDAFALAQEKGDASPPGLIQWGGRAFRISFMKMSAVSGALCLFEDVTALHRRANTDGLTGLWNRRYFDEALANEIARRQRYGTDQPLSLVMVDVDHFKKVNDNHGHQIGDRVLVMVAAALQRLVRTTDLAVRYGGEEMTLLLPHTDLQGAGILAERVRQEIAALVPTDAEGQPFQVTASFGVSTCRRNEGADELLARADKALYESKESGRNRVTLAD